MPRPRPVRLPYASLGTLFKGRAAVLSQIHDAVRRGGRYGASLTAQAIEGPGGVGKTRAAVEYAWVHRDDYTALLFVTAETPDAMTHDLAALTDVVGLSHLDNQPDEDRRSAVMAWLNANPGWLLILDNVDTEAAATAAGALLDRLTGGHVLLTSRLHGFAHGVEAISLDVLDRTDAAALLLEGTEGSRFATPTDPADSISLAEALGGLPLALEMAAATIRARHWSLADYRRLWSESRDALTGQNEPAISHYHRRVETTLLGAVEMLSADARALLERLAFFAPDPVPESLLDVATPNSATVEATRAALIDLAAHSLVNRAPDAAAFAVPPQVQDVTRRSLDATTASRRLIEALGWIDAAFAGDPQNVRSWTALDPLAPHAEAVAGFADTAGIAEPTARLMSMLGSLFQYKSLHARAEPLLRRALAIDEASYGAAHPNVAIRLSNLATLLQATNRLEEAEPICRRALAIDEASCGDAHPRVAIRLNNLATLLQATNRLEEAEPLMRRALAIDEASYGAAHPNVAIGLNNLAALLKATNRLGEAEPLMRRPIVIFLMFQRDTGHPHPHRDAALTNYTILLQEMGRGEAEIAAELRTAMTEAGLDSS